MSSVRVYLSDDHARLDALLAAVLRTDGSIDQPSYAAFRRGLLRHIGIEEKILFPVIRQRGGDVSVVERLHRDHALLSALLVVPPAATEIREILEVLAEHNMIEERSGGMYQEFERLAGDDLPALTRRAIDYPEVPVMPHVDTPLVRQSIETLRKARSG